MQIFVLVSEQPDHSGAAELIRAFENETDAHDAKAMIDACNPMMTIRVAQVHLNRTY